MPGSCPWESHPLHWVQTGGALSWDKEGVQKWFWVVLVGVNALFNIMDCTFPVGRA